MAVVAGIRVGDVLRSTKHLRRWLRAASLELHLYDRWKSERRDSSVELYTPRRDDQFVVAANGERIFVVFSARQNIIIPFVNPLPQAPAVVSQNEPHFLPESLLDEANPKLRMDGRIFSTWFIKTGQRQTSLSEWPAYARTLWLGGHMNGMDGAFLDGSPAHPLAGSQRTRNGTISWNWAQVFGELAGNIGHYHSKAVGPASAVTMRRAAKPHVSLFKGNLAKFGMGPTFSELRILERSIEYMQENLEEKTATRHPARKTSPVAQTDQWIINSDVHVSAGAEALPTIAYASNLMKSKITESPENISIWEQKKKQILAALAEKYSSGNQ